LLITSLNDSELFYILTAETGCKFGIKALLPSSSKSPIPNMYYIVSLTLPLQSTQVQAVEALVVFTAFMFLQFAVSRMLTVASVAEAEAGAVCSLPSSFIGRVVSPVHSLTTLIPPVVYILCVAFNRFMQPNWMQHMSIPNNYVHQETEVALRVATCASTFALLRFFEYALKHLGNQWHVIGVWCFLHVKSRRTDQLPSPEAGEIQARADRSICSGASSSVYVSRSPQLSSNNNDVFAGPYLSSRRFFQ